MILPRRPYLCRCSSTPEQWSINHFHSRWQLRGTPGCPLLSSGVPIKVLLFLFHSKILYRYNFTVILPKIFFLSVWYLTFYLLEIIWHSTGLTVQVNRNCDQCPNICIPLFIPFSDLLTSLLLFFASFSSLFCHFPLIYLPLKTIFPSPDNTFGICD